MNSVLNKKVPVSPDPALQFVFAIFAVLTWLSAVVRLSYDAMMTAGILQICLGIAAYTGGHINLRRGDPHSNINLILSVILGFASGLTHVAQAVASLAHLRFHPWVFSVVLLIGGLYMLCFLPLMAKAPAYVFCEHLCVCSGLILFSLSDLLALPVLKIIGAWLLLVFALLALYQGVCEMFAQYGRKLPQGRPLFH